jgi:hypothetical protein
MNKISRLLACLFFSKLSASAYASPAMNSIVDCTSITADGSSTFQVSAIGNYTGPSPFMLANGTTVYVGGYSTNYEIVQGFDKGFDTLNLTEVELANAKTGIVVRVVGDDFGICTVSVTAKNGTKDDCASCTLCGNETYTVDCTNIENGRMVDCESAAIGMVYFPLTEVALGAAPTSSSTSDRSTTTSGATCMNSLLFVLASISSLLASDLIEKYSTIVCIL